MNLDDRSIEKEEGRYSNANAKESLKDRAEPSNKKGGNRSLLEEEKGGLGAVGEKAGLFLLARSRSEEFKKDEDRVRKTGWTP